jgi:hypothetical protein
MLRILSPAAIIAVFCFAAISVTAAESQDRGTAEEQKACTPDVFRLCSTYIPDEKQIVACLKQNKDKLSPACRKVFS